MLIWGAVLLGSLIGAVFDIRQRRIPNILTCPLFVGGLAFSVYQGGGSALGGALESAALLSLPYIFLFATGLGGAGDAKMMGALGAWLCLPHGFHLLVAVVISGAVLGLVYSVLRGRGVTTAKNLSSMVLLLPWVALGPGRLRDRAGVLTADQTMTRMPYGVAIFVGSCLAAGGVWIWRL